SMYFLLFLFFFSSRRRHTRSYGDWSSDVCSSDLWRDQLLGGQQRGEAISSDRLVKMAAAVSSIHNVQYHSAYFMRVIMDERLTGVVAQLIGDDVQLHHTKYHVKPPTVGAPFPMHEDYPYFPHESHTLPAAA